MAGYVGEQAAYHHGEASLHGTIINMAQNFVGSSNINLLYPSGQFGTRLEVGFLENSSADFHFNRVEKMRLARVTFSLGWQN